jgi:N-hydroxyarylamine O-acetyltransferase
VSSGNGFDLDGYIARINYHGPREPNAQTLAALHIAHLGAIPFENIDVILGRGVPLDIESLQAKLVRGRRGGYCFEHNTLFAAALGQLGFAVTTLEARVRPPGATHTLPRTHMVLRVDIDGRALLADVGFGGDGPLEPVALDGEGVAQGGDAYRVTSEGRLKVLQIRRGGEWQDLYAFTLDEALPVDFAVANHYTSTFPESPFVKTLTAQISLLQERRILRGSTLTVRHGHDEHVRQVAANELIPLLESFFGIRLPAGTRLPPNPG